LRRSLGKDADGPVCRWLNRPRRPGCQCSWPRCGPLAAPWSWSRATSPSTPSATELACTSSPPARPNVNGTSDTKSGAGRRGPCGTGCWTGWADAAVHAGLGLWALDGRAPEGVLVLTVAATTGALLSLVGGRPGGYYLRPSGRWGGCWAAGTGACCWSLWARSWAHLGAVAWPTGAFLRRPPARDAGWWS
jgi:hypothetical protein